MKVLVVEDSGRLRRSPEHGLRRSGFAVDVVGDGAEGLAWARHGRYDVVVLDLMLRGLPRHEVVRRRAGRGGVDRVPGAAGGRRGVHQLAAAPAARWC